MYTINHHSSTEVRTEPPSKITLITIIDVPISYDTKIQLVLSLMIMEGLSEKLMSSVAS